MTRRIYSDGDQITLDEAFNRMLTGSGGLRPGYPSVFSSLYFDTIGTPTTLYVATNGSDDNQGNSSQPFLTIAAAIESIKGLWIEAPVKISVGPGNFDGFALTCLNIGPDGSFSIEGTRTAVDSGTFTSTASLNGGLISLTDNTKTWVADSFNDYYVDVSTSSGVRTFKIAKTTSTVLTVCDAGTIVSPTTYTIYSLSTTLTGTGVVSTTSAPTNNLTVSPAMAVVAIALDSMLANSVVQIRRFNVIGTGTATPIAIRGFSQLQIEQCILSKTSSAISLLTLGGTVQVTVGRCGFKDSSNSTGILANTLGTTGSVIVNGCTFLGATGSNGILISAMNFASVTGNYFKSYATGFNVANGAKISQASSNTYESCTTGLAVTAHSFVNSINASMFTSCTTAILTTGHSVIFGATVLGSGNTTIMSIATGSRVQVGSASTITGTTEISLDGVTTTLTAMRALSPKVFPATPNAYGTYVYE